MPLLFERRGISVTQFEARCLEVLDAVERLGIEVIATKRRRPIARIVPLHARDKSICGALAHLVLHVGDIVSPVEVV
ncbi:MAG: type II toxin-antitoxin system prevent-host-death family antitoxin [bacterium]|nr:type II toxin-antitoxin system prevent-host-death family antitoxin [bacterium]